MLSWLRQLVSEMLALKSRNERTPSVIKLALQVKWSTLIETAVLINRASKVGMMKSFLKVLHALNDVRLARRH